MMLTQATALAALIGMLASAPWAVLMWRLQAREQRRAAAEIEALKARIAHLTSDRDHRVTALSTFSRQFTEVEARVAVAHGDPTRHDAIDAAIDDLAVAFGAERGWFDEPVFQVVGRLLRALRNVLDVSCLDGPVDPRTHAVVRDRYRIARDAFDDAVRAVLRDEPYPLLGERASAGRECARSRGGGPGRAYPSERVIGHGMTPRG